MPGHPLHTFKLENSQIRKVITSIEEMLAQFAQQDKLGDADRQALQDQIKMLQEIDKHYLRKENQLFPVLERYGVSGPSRVMWQFHDDVRAMLKEVVRGIPDKEPAGLKELITKLLTTISDMIYKEENILFPMAMEKLSEEGWGKVRSGEEEIGYTLVRPGSVWQPPESAQTAHRPAAAEAIPLDTGYLTPAQLNLMLTHLPLDLTYVDENDQVQYYSQGRERAFPRSPGIIGRKVQNCHPSDSVQIVNKIVQEFKQGTKSMADFRLQMGAKMFYIQYLALRVGNGVYRGVVEVTQDISYFRSLTGQKKLLDW